MKLKTCANCPLQNTEFTSCQHPAALNQWDLDFEPSFDGTGFSNTVSESVTMNQAPPKWCPLRIGAFTVELEGGSK